MAVASVRSTIAAAVSCRSLAANWTAPRRAVNSPVNRTARQQAVHSPSLAGREFAPGVGSWITLGPGAGAAGAGAFVAGAAAEGDGGALGSAFSVSVRVSADEVPPSSNRRKAMWTPPTMIITTAAATITLRRCCVRLPGIDAPLPAFAPPGRSRGEAAAATCAARRAAAM